MFSHSLFYDEMDLYERRHIMDRFNIQVSDTWWSEMDMHENEKQTRGPIRDGHVYNSPMPRGQTQT